jgi:hypothetical protein
MIPPMGFLKNLLIDPSLAAGVFRRGVFVDVET